jgi:glyoxylase-like metal-dependent hydrolase (beta-lactamase superfamily II)
MGCCQAEYLDRPVGPYTVDVPLDDGQILGLGDADRQVVRIPGHAPATCRSGSPSSGSW